MKLLTETQHAQLLANGQVNLDRRLQGLDSIDFKPVVKLFTPDAAATWLLSEIDPEDGDTAFGLCDLGMGFPELGTVSLSELADLRGKLNLPVECDLHFCADRCISVYADEAQKLGVIQV